MQRYDIIKYLIKINDYTSYLEIGVLGRETLDKIKLPIVDGVDPNGYGNYTMTSDQFFKIIDKTYDIIFIDGLHLHEQALRDIKNSLTFLNKNGTIVIHDCLPTEEWHQTREGISGKPWTGDVWKAFADLRCERTDLKMYTVDTDWGCGIIEFGTQVPYLKPQDEWTWDYFVNNRKTLMNIISVEEFLGYI